MQMRIGTPGRMVSLACAALLAATGLLLAAEATEEKELGDGWVAVYLKEQRIGYVHTHALQRGEGAQALFATETEQHISVTRGQHVEFMFVFRAEIFPMVLASEASLESGPKVGAVSHGCHGFRHVHGGFEFIFVHGRPPPHRWHNSVSLSISDVL